MYEMLPEPVGKPVVEIADLGEFGTRHFFKGRGRQAAGPHQGKWPEFALEVHRFSAEGKEGKLLIPLALGPSRPAEYREPVREFLHTLEKKSRSDEWNRLRGLEGKWPEYPREVVRLARQHNLSAPGMMLPGPPRRWEETYGPPPRGRP